jgi:NADH-quinone oxidoreductase subunit J
VVVWVFLASAAVAIVFAFAAVMVRNPLYNVLSLVVVFFAMAAIFAILGMDFLAAIQVIVYSGAILVLFLFVIMLLNVRRLPPIASGRPLLVMFGTVLAALLGGFLLALSVLLTPDRGAVLPDAVESGTALPIGKALISTHLFAFEFITVILAAAIVGAVYLGRRDPR